MRISNTPQAMDLQKYKSKELKGLLRQAENSITMDCGYKRDYKLLKLIPRILSSRKA